MCGSNWSQYEACLSITTMATRFVRTILLLQLLIAIAITGPLGCYSSPAVDDMTRLTSTAPRGIKGALIHRDRFASPSANYLSPAQKLEEDAWRSLQRMRSLSTRGRVLVDAPNSSPSGQPEDWETPLSDATFGEYLMEISLGTPPQKFVAVADTGSDLVWLRCLPCVDCSDEARFDPSLSTSYAPLPCSSSFCQTLDVTVGGCTYTPAVSSTATSNSTDNAGCVYGYSYGDGSQTIGTLAQETISIMDLVGGSVQAEPNFWFGCSYNASSDSGLYDKADGLVGLGRGNASFPSQLGKYFGNKFSYCLVNRSSNSVETSPLIFGDAAEPAGTPLQFTPLITNPLANFSTFYYVNLEEITVNGTPVPNIPKEAFVIDQKNGTGGTIFDSGTTYTAFGDEIYDPLAAAVSVAIVDFQPVNVSESQTFELCYTASWDKWVSAYGNGVPALSFMFDGKSTPASYNLKVEHAWFPYSHNTVCFTILRSLKGTAVNIIGNFQQVGFLVLYDLDNKQIGFGPGNCTGTPISTSNRPVVNAAMSTVTLFLSMVFVLTF